MNTGKHRGGWLILFSFVLALALTIVPLPAMLELFRPEWLAMVLIYWCMAVPTRVGVSIGWLVGLMLDVSRDALLGQYALAFALIAFLTLHLHQRLRVFPIWQQALSVGLLVTLECLIVLWIKGLTGQSPGIWKMLVPAFSSLLFWPVIYLLLRYMRRAYQVS
jgi:rod shape-determining protein MreD